MKQALTITRQTVAQCIDHSLLNPNLKADAALAGCREALEWGVAAVCIMPCYVRLCAEILRGSAVVPCTVVGFPHGTQTSDTKLFEIRQSLAHGARELDMVVNVPAVVSENWEYVHEEIRAATHEIHNHGARLKLIFETGFLSDAQKIRLCKLCVDLGVDWAKTSTGFGPTGATPSDVTLMVDHCNPRVQVKAAGGVRDLQAVLMFRSMGCTRIGCSRTASILAECEKHV